MYPDTASPHRRPAQVFVYVLDGSVRMQVDGGTLVTLGPVVKDKGAPITSAAAPDRGK